MAVKWLTSHSLKRCVKYQENRNIRNKRKFINPLNSRCLCMQLYKQIKSIIGNPFFTKIPSFSFECRRLRIIFIDWCALTGVIFVVAIVTMFQLFYLFQNNGSLDKSIGFNQHFYPINHILLSDGSIIHGIQSLHCSINEIYQGTKKADT